MNTASQPKAYTVLKLGAMGDVLAATPVLRALRQSGGKVGVITSHQCAPLLRGNPDAQQVWGVRPQGIGGLWDLWRALRRQRRSTLILLHRRGALALLARLAGMHSIVGFRGSWGDRFITQGTAWNESVSRAARVRSLLQTIGILSFPDDLRLELTGEELRPAEEYWERLSSTHERTPQAPLSGRRIVVAPGGGANCWSRMPTRRWPVSSFVDLVRSLSQQGAVVALVGGANDSECSEIIRQTGTMAENTARRHSIRESAALISRAELLITNDSLPLYLASARGVPVIALYGPTSARLVHPPRTRGFAIQGYAGCGPCYSPSAGLRGSAYCCSTGDCLKSIAPAVVLRCAEQLVREPARWQTVFFRSGGNESGMPPMAKPKGARGKRVLDIALSSAGLLLLSPLLAVLLLAILGESSGAPLYQQWRTGKDGLRFRMWKLRTMVEDAEQGGPRFAVAGDERVTRLGAALRKTRWDELPQLWNVLRGDMTLVGPRPERPEFTRLFSQQIPGYTRRFAARPGLTGLAQLELGYCDTEGTPRKTELDLRYLQTQSVRLDAHILLKTAWRFVTGSITARGLVPGEFSERTTRNAVKAPEEDYALRAAGNY